MHHLYPLAKGDPLCPLGFHPQVRWPTRCKRCFRDYKEHGGKTRRDDSSLLNKSDATVSTPSLTTWGNDDGSKRSWGSSGNLAFDKDQKGKTKQQEFSSNPSSWESTPDLSSLNDNAQANIPTVNIKLPTRKQRPVDRTVSDSVSFRNDSYSKPLREDKTKRIHIKEIKTIPDSTESSSSTNNDVKRTPKQENKTPDYSTDTDDNVSLAGTETTDTTLVDQNEIEYRDQIDSLKKELETTKSKCDRLEKEKSNILLRRLTAMETSSSKNSTEVLKLQQKCNELQNILDDYKDEKKILSLKVKELEEEVDQRPTAQQAQKIADDLRSKLLAAETLCEELMDENEDMKKELRDLEDEMEEMQDNFREDQADEYTSLKKELEQTTKNCRILSFKLRKTERKVEQLETEKGEIDKKLQEVSTGGENSSGYLEKIKNLEKELSAENERNENLRKELEDAKTKLETPKTKAPMLGSTRFATERKVSRESLTRGGSQEDPAQLLRDLQDSMEREADLKEQLKFAEEELRQQRKKRVIPVKVDVELPVYRKPVPLVLFNSEFEEKAIQTDIPITILPKYEQRYQLSTSMYNPRKDFSPMTALISPIGRKLSPTNAGNRSSDQSMEKDEGISDDEDVGELKLQLELSEQEASVLRKKVEELEGENERAKKKTKELQDKLAIKPKKTLDAEIKALQKKLEESEKECQKLKRKPIEKQKSIEILDQNTLDLKSQLQAVEQEANLLRTRVQNLENDNEKLTTENKRYQLSRNTKSLKSDKSLNKYIDQIATLEVELGDANNKIKDLTDKLNEATKIDNSKLKSVETERDVLIETLNKLKQDSSKSFRNRTPKKPNELTTKSQLKTWVNDLEKEISDVLVVLHNSESSKNKLQEELNEIKSEKKNPGDIAAKLAALEKELANEKGSLIKEKSKNDELTKKLSKMKDSENLKATNLKLQEEISKLTDEINNLKNELSSKTVKSDNAKVKELNKLKGELEEKSRKLLVIEKDYKDIEEKYQKIEKEKKQEINKLEHRLEEEKNKLQSESKNHITQIDDLNNSLLCLETTIKSKNMLIKQLEDSLEKERSESSTKTKTDTKQLSDLKDELAKVKSNLAEIEGKLGVSEKNKKTAESKVKKLEDEYKTEKLKLQKKVSELEVDVQNEKKKIDILKNNYEKEHKNKEIELGILRNKIKSLESNGNSKKMINEIKQEYQTKIEKLENVMGEEKKEYEELTAKYEILEEEHVVTKAKLVAEISALNNQINAMKKQEEEKAKEAEKHSRNGNDLERVRLKATLEETKLELDQIKREYNVINDQMEYMRRENDELRRKLDDYDKVSKIQRTISADSTALEFHVKELQSKLSNAEKAKKSDLAEFKLRYESQIKIINDELRSLQTQVTRFKRERDTYKHMLEGAQKTIGELKNSDRPSSNERRKSASSIDEIEDYKMKVASLEQQISCMEDELSEARLESSKLKTELVSGRSTYEVKLSELHSRVNELEEEKILISGRTKIAGLRTRMELAWHKEREEQQRLLQETATLARDLRQTLYEVERERDKEKLEGRRKLEQLKKSGEEEQEETKRKLNELQCDLLELRDAHAKLRTTNEKLRREKERNERERGEMKGIIQGRKRTDQNEDRRLSILLEQIESLVQSAPDWCQPTQSYQAPYTPTPPRRTRASKSRESSPALEGSRNSKESSVPRDDKSAQFKTAMRRLSEAADELKRSQKLNEEDRERERIKRAMGTRRATSTEHDDTDIVGRMRHYSSRNGNLTSSLHRKSLSLEHTSAIHEQNIWKGDADSVSSVQSLEYGSDAENARYARRDVGLDSRLSGGSTQSDVVGEKKKKKGIIGKLKKFTKSRSIDDQDPGHFSSNEALSLTKPDSTSDVAEDTKGSKKDLKERLTGIFKRSGSSSRSNSLERQSKPKDNTSSTQRPLMRTEFQR
ncbi:putative leucine-rich repeat-containing protein DDB_G0290503 isoform X2 [Onthophagus taurus]|uniref:putative leucine-rich repeat-containing protein DDB_G0290503 isoform X2 n=1 Tax=Onthophagus taurus TaxID=166361 RepID=UPI0039BEA519